VIFKEKIQIKGFKKLKEEKNIFNEKCKININN
jgi:hypothetical protein